MTTIFHVYATGVLGIIALGIWLHLFFGRGWFWNVKKVDADGEKVPALDEWPSVIAVIPARNEAETIGQVVADLIQQDYLGKLSVVIVDDYSEDETASIAKKVALENGAQARVRVIHASNLPDGWTGKLWALNEGVASTQVPGAVTEIPELLWFTDADVAHAPDTLRRLVAWAQRDKLDLVSLMVLLRAGTFPERALIPAFVYFFLMLYPPAWIADEELGTAGAAGGCMLLKREALERIGGLAAIRAEVIDDCALARAVKGSGGRVSMRLTKKSTSLRGYGTFTEIRDLIARTAFTQLRYSSLQLAGTLVGMFLIYIAPVALLFAHDSSAKILGLIACFLMLVSFLPTVRFYRLAPFWAPLLPLVAAFYSYATWLSAWRYWLGHGGQWKGRAQAPEKPQRSVY
jgi:hopene-associated glycosyltransferase HpnB